MQKHLVSREQVVDLFKGKRSALGIEEVDQGDEAGVENGEIDVGPVADGLDRHRRDFDYQEGELRRVYAQSILANPSTRARLTIQFEAEPKAAEAARIGVGEYSEGKSQGMANRPTAKKKLNRNNMVAATIPVPLPVTDVVPARTAMHEA